MDKKLNHYRLDALFSQFASAEKIEHRKNDTQVCQLRI